MKKLCAFLALVLSLAFAGVTFAQDKLPRRRTNQRRRRSRPRRRKRRKRKRSRRRSPTRVTSRDAHAPQRSCSLMSVPALALFYGGMVRSKERALHADAVFVVFFSVTVLCASTATALPSPKATPLRLPSIRLFLKGTFDPAKGDFSMAATFQQGVRHPRAGVRGVPRHVRASPAAWSRGDLPSAPSSRRSDLHRAVVLRSATRRSPTWCGSGWARTRTPRQGGRRDEQQGRPHLAMGSSRLCCGTSCTSTRRRGPGRRVPHRQAHRLRQRSHAPAQPHAHHKSAAALLWTGWFGSTPVRRSRRTALRRSRSSTPISRRPARCLPGLPARRS